MEKVYLDFTTQFSSRMDINPFNQRKTTIRQLVDNPEYQKVMTEYWRALTNFQEIDTILGPLQDDHRFEFEYRSKLEDSLYLKIAWYLRKQHDLYVGKSINDLFGGRIILADFRPYEKQILAYLLDKHDTMVSRPYIRDDDTYHALHLYIRKDNFSFPWELQIWDTADVQTNFQAHAAHEERKERRQ
ncbi:hypothetical protein L248_0692 [Schleiferilactobacillus shenzhenensis LY-73]|uniref:RelA/SpoT domain-containing protein n=2 Tax=Schleiferilactobacillus shenzhenensis TaxID=1231337 RepID=U4TMI4_9LACO|nr:hypothetical protein L248_0692 [Schleiferilactobacillus shenzhenensis LY-73]